MITGRVRKAVTPQRQRAQMLRLRLQAGTIYERHAARAREAGIDDLRLVLSFDCDTAEDITAAPAVHERLLDMGVQPVYAVPGELLRRGAEVYARFASTGSEFLNHGGREHTYFDEGLGRHASCFFYDEIGSDRVRADIAWGHELVQDILGIRPVGFRTPHFGTYQSVRQLRFLHSVLAEYGYEFSSSTTPAWGLREGPVARRFGLPELAVSGHPSAPLEILDTWSCFAAPDRVRNPDDFRREAEALAAGHAAAGPGLINIYGDPSHVAGEDAFFEGIEAIRAVARPCGYSDVMALLR